nr:nicotinate-nucleotide adenylyltransferase [Motiliproteus sediminis]
MVAMMGGTFDPVHHGHLRTALELRDRLHPDRLHLIPCHRPVHRDRPSISAQQRLRMVELAIEGESGLLADDRELRSDRPSYSVDTLGSLRAELGPDCALAMVIGTDALLGLQSWHRWEELLQLAHIVVVRRPGWVLSPDHPLADWVVCHQLSDPADLRRRPAGGVLWQEFTPLAISATQIREVIARGGSPRYLIPDSVWRFIREQGLYVTSHD